MLPVIISCKTLQRELLSVMKKLDCRYPIVWLDSGLHNVPKKLNAIIQQHLDQIHGCDTVLLAMSLCGNSVIGLQTHDFQLILPRTDDCISLLLGDQERPFATLFMTEGWLEGGRHIGQEYDECLEKYGPSRGKRIFAAMLKNYRYIAMLDTGCYDTAAAEAEIRRIGEKLGLEYTALTGTVQYLEKLLLGNWNPEEFVILPPNSTLDQTLSSMN